MSEHKIVPDEIMIAREIAPNQSDLQTYFYVVFSQLDGYIALRSFAEQGCGNAGGKPPSNRWISADDNVAANAMDFANLASSRRSAFYVIPGTVSKEGAASSSDVTGMQVLLIDIDDGDTEGKLTELTAVLGEPTMVVESGGVTECGQPKLHVYWQLTRGVSGDDLAKLLQLRHDIAVAFGGDTHFKSAHQPIRVAGSVYYKNGSCRLVKIRCYNPLEYELGELIERFGYVGSMWANDASERSISANKACAPLSQLLTSKVYAGGSGEQTRFNHLSRVIGYWLRRCHDGLITHEQAIEEILAYNTANVVPAWPVDKIKQTVNGLWQKHVKKNGEMKTNCHSAGSAEGAEHIDSSEPNGKVIKLADWTANRYVDKAPEQNYLVESVIPMRVATILAATGDAGKSMLLLNLALQVASGNDNTETFGHRVIQKGTAIVFTAEDDIEEVHRRLEYLDPKGLRHQYPERLIIVPLASTGGPLSCIVKSREGIKVSPEFLALKQQITAITDLKLIVFDPLSSFVQADIAKDPSDGSFVTSVFASLATETGAAVILAHHMRKPQGNYQINTPEEAREAVRGSGALVDGVRNVYSLWQSPKEEQRMVFNMLGLSYERNKVYRGAIVKCNTRADREVHIFLRSEQGLLKDVSKMIKGQELTSIQLNAILRDSIAHSAAEGFPYTHTGPNGIYKQRHKLPKVFHSLPRQKIEEMVQDMLNARPALIVKGRAKGSKEEKWLDVPEGNFARGEGVFTEGAEAEPAW